MKFIHVFLLWLYANLILIGFSLLALISGKIYDKTSNNDYELYWLVILYGIGITLPSLSVLLLFHFVVRKVKALNKSYFKTYFIAVVIINFIYLVCSYYIFTMGKRFSLFFIFTTLAGILSLLLIRRKIKREQLIL